MKKLFAIILALVMVLALCACGSSGGSGSASGSDKDSGVKLDYESTEKQTITDERATNAVLADTMKTWLGGLTVFAGSEQSSYTYEDFVKQIGCEASSYNNDDSQSARQYTWCAKESEDSQMTVWFMKDGSAWHLYMLGSTGIS